MNNGVNNITAAPFVTYLCSECLRMSRLISFLLLWFFSGNSIAMSGPVIPLRICVNINDSVATFEWNNGPDPCASLNHHRIYGRKNADTFGPMFLISSSTLESITFKMPDLDPSWQFFWVSYYACNGIDSFISDTIIPDLIFPASTPLDSVSIDLGSQKLVAGWQKGASADTRGYRLYRYSNSINDSIDETGLLTYTFSQFADPFQQIALATFDSCFKYSYISDHHAPIRLTGSFDTCTKTATLNWTPYVGWVADRQAVFIQNNQQPYRELASLTSSSVAHLYDQVILGDSVCFFIRSFSGTKSSSSNEVCFHTRKKIVPTKNYLLNLTVANNQHLEGQWEGAALEDVQTMDILKSCNGGSPVVWKSMSPVSAFNLIDAGPDVQKDICSYSFILKDNCDEILSTSNISHNILLNLNDKTLSWNAYNGWSGIVDNYQLFSNSGSTWNNTPFGSPFTYQLTLKETELPQVCFYVEAYEGQNPDNNNQISRSNSVCHEGPFSVFSPNVIIPSGNNNRFVVKGVNINESLSNYYIYNRWGEILFRSEKITDEWYGDYMGSPVPPGLYFYVIEAFSNKGEKKTIKGEIRIIR